MAERGAYEDIKLEINSTEIRISEITLRQGLDGESR